MRRLRISKRVQDDKRSDKYASVPDTQAMPDGNDYEVGYAKPPRATRFKPGQSGNPKGRPKGVRNFKTDVKATLKSPVKLSREGKARKVTTQAAMLLRLREKALGGDGRALDRLITLAQAYNNEDVTASDALSVDDANLLAVYRERLLRGAANIDPPKEGETSDPTQISRGPTGRAGEGDEP
ncbi:MAG: hypothetical protein IT539_04590 [Bradyrhizobiaceae bacterium]|nr:hypothetical protein [Bradyrhizobiaceae bacterium]